ncbi:HNH endonuclease [Micrococcus luteus]|uniref:HNH endonuclease n=1 Tax=Micrococcus luteus TaxID=1270 RepID=UPI001AE32564|nr:HNH endonuclease [Micrococcus luteus]QTP19089.1 HNH endonuclease [Micrococcus luteus]
MPRDLMHQEPERAAMSTLSDLLGIPHFTTSTGGTVRRDFLEAVATALGARPGDLAGLDKDGVLALAWELARHEPAPPEAFSRGGTVKNWTLQAVIDGVIEHGLGPALTEEPAPGGFHDLEDERRRRVAEQAVREGQGGFRDAVLTAYDGRCAVTGTDLPAALEAAHIAPYRGQASHEVSNALCLRADIHGLFDRHMLAVHEDDYAVLLAPAVLASSYADLQGRTLLLPRVLGLRPDREALARHRAESGL